MRDVNAGWIIRYAHANGASMFFILVYLHIARGIYYGSFTKPRLALWSVGVIIFLLLVITAFLGYTLVAGQMSLWGSIVITNLLSAIPWIGGDLVEYIWGGSSVGNPTLNRFFSFHYLLPFILTALVLIHLMFLHVNGSSNPLGLSANTDKIYFHPYYTFKDLVGLMIYIILFTILIFFMPNLLGLFVAYFIYNIIYNAICWDHIKFITTGIIKFLNLY